MFFSDLVVSIIYISCRFVGKSISRTLEKTELVRELRINDKVKSSAAFLICSQGNSKAPNGFLNRGMKVAQTEFDVANLVKTTTAAYGM